MKSIPANAVTLLAQDLATEPVNFVEIQWVEGGGTYRYGDKENEANNIEGRIVAISNLTFAAQISGSETFRAQIVLDDTDGVLRALLDSNDVHRQPAQIFQWFEGLDFADRFAISPVCRINSPIEWDEGARTVTVELLSTIETREVGFSVEEGDFPDPPEDLLGKPWPLMFGTVCDEPTLQTRSPVQGILRGGVGIRDFTLAPRLCQAKYILCPPEPVGEQFPPGVFQNFEDFINNFTSPLGEDNGPEQEQQFAAQQQCVDFVCAEIAELEFNIAQQASFEFDEIEIIGGEKFPQGEQITLDIDGGLFVGIMDGETFTILSRQHPDFAEVSPTIPPCMSIPDITYEWGPSGSSSWSRMGGSNAFSWTGAVTCDPDDFTAGYQRTENTGVSESQKYYDSFPTGDFFWARSGSIVTLASDQAKIIYIANLLPSTVARASAVRRLADGEVLMTLPDDMYDVVTTDYTGAMVTELVFDKLPSQVDDKWDDTVYVSLTSDIGPNTADIIEYLIEKYTSLTVDAASFAAVKSALTNYPMGFLLEGRPDALEAAREIATQARCALLIRGSTVFLHYLSAEPASVRTLDETDLLDLTLYHSPSNEVYTKIIGEWSRSGYQAELEVDTNILRHNVARYGVSELTQDYYAYNVFQHVNKSQTFWLIRHANTWRRVRFTTTIAHIALDPFDCITLDVPMLGPSTKALIESVDYDSETHKIQFDAWLPQIAGTNTQHTFAWPATAAAAEEWPSPADIQSGKAGSGGGDSFDMIPPPGHLLASLTTTLDTVDERARSDWGDRFPSDIGDVLIETTCPDGVDVDLTDEEAPLLRAFRRQQRDMPDDETKDAGGGGGGSSQDDDDEQEEGQCGGAVGTACCIYTVTVTFGTPTLVTGEPGDEPFLKSQQGDRGHLANIQQTQVQCTQFDWRPSAEAVFQGYAQEIQRKHAEADWVVGENGPWLVTWGPPMANPNAAAGQGCGEIAC